MGTGIVATRAGTGFGRRMRSSFPGVAAALGMLALLVAIPVALNALRGPEAITSLVAGLYDLLGADASAAGLRQRGMTPVTGKILTATSAVVVGVGGTWSLFAAGNVVLERLFGPRRRARLAPLLFVGPAFMLVGLFLVFPMAGTIWTSITDGGGFLDNYRFALTDADMLVAFRNNLIWLVVATTGSVVIGLGFAGLVDRVRREALAKTFVFLPLAISFVGAGVIWQFVYAWRPAGQDQIGLLNSMVTALGFEPVSWLTTTPINTLALIVIMIWLQTGFAMVILSAAIKAVPDEVLEAARIDGANERQVFFRIVLPMIRTSILVVAVTIVIAVLKVFDIVFVMTGGNHDTEVVANRMFTEMFTFRSFGRASALAVVLLVAVIPIMIVNVRHLSREGPGS